METIKAMKVKVASMLMWIFMLCLLQHSDAQTLDQSQMIYNGGMSARHLTGYTIMQSFTAGLTGTLSRIDVGFFGTINGSGTLNIYAGTGILGTLLQSLPVTVVCPSGNYMITFLVSVPVTAGQVYTFQFIPGAGILDPYGVQVVVPSSYSGGSLYVTDPSGTYNSGNDMVFQTFVNTNPLPVHLIMFTAERKDENSVLNWATVSEINNAYFGIESSSDATRFEEIARVPGSGNSTINVDYTYTDEHPYTGISYYRLKQTDFDGKSTYSEIVAVRFENKKFEILNLVPDYVEQTIHLSVNDNSSEKIDYRIFDILSKTFSYGTEFTSPGINNITIQTPQIPAGIYYLEINNGFTFLVSKIFYGSVIY